MNGAVYKYWIEDGPGHFVVEKRWVDKKNKPHMDEYLVSLKKGKWHCACKGYNFSKTEYKIGTPKTKSCHHIKFIKEELKKSDWGILEYRLPSYKFKWENWFKEYKEEGEEENEKK